MSALDLFSYIAWTLSSPGDGCALKVDRGSVEWCDGKTCTPVTQVSADSPDHWKLEPQEVSIRWTHWSEATTICQSEPASLSVTFDANTGDDAPPVPRERVNKALGLPGDTVVPGRWHAATRACIDGTKAWSFTPFGSRDAVYVDQNDGAWRVLKLKSGVPVMCPGGSKGGLYPPIPSRAGSGAP